MKQHGPDGKSPTYAPAYVVGIYPDLVAKARELGYALALHGSLARDFDVLAVPWTDEAVDAVTLVKELAANWELTIQNEGCVGTIKPHNRRSWTLLLWWGAYIDISVMLRAQDIKEKSDD